MRIISISGAPQQRGIAGEQEQDGGSQREVDDVRHGLLPPWSFEVTLVLPKSISAPCGTALSSINDL
jgi:hypothetical protein